jgi:hypothetical protein
VPYCNHGLTGEQHLAFQVLLAAVEDLRKGDLQARLLILSDVFLFWCRWRESQDPAFREEGSWRNMKDEEASP